MTVTRLPTTITTRRTTPEWSKGALRRGGRLLGGRSWERLSNAGWWDLSYIHISHCSEVFFCNELLIMSARWSGWCCEECWHRGTDPVTTRSSAIFSKYCDADLTLSHHHHHYYCHHCQNPRTGCHHCPPSVPAFDSGFLRSGDDDGDDNVED